MTRDWVSTAQPMDDTRCLYQHPSMPPVPQDELITTVGRSDTTIPYRAIVTYRLHRVSHLYRSPEIMERDQTTKVRTSEKSVKTIFPKI